MHRQGRPKKSVPVFQRPVPTEDKKVVPSRMKDPEDVAEYMELIKSFRVSLEDQIREMRLLVVLGEDGIKRSAKQDMVQFLRQMNSDLIELDEAFSEVGWEKIVGLHPPPEKVWPSDLKKEAERAEATIVKLYAEFQIMWKGFKGATLIIPSSAQRLETFSNSLNQLKAQVQEQKTILNNLKYTEVELYTKRQDFRESMNESIRELQIMRQAAVEAGATLWDFKDVATEKELKKFHQTQNQILEDVMIQKATQQMLDQQEKAGKIIRLYSSQTMASESRTKENKEAYLRALKDYNETVKRLLRNLSLMFRGEAQESAQGYTEEIDLKLSELLEALGDFFRGTWNMTKAKKMVKDAHRQNLADMEAAVSKTKPAPPPSSPPKVINKDKGVQPPPLFQDYVEEWDEYAVVLDGQVARMEPFSLFRKPSKKERGLGSAQAQADSFQSQRNEMLGDAIFNWEQAKQDPDVAPWLKNYTTWSLYEINLRKTKVDTLMKEFLRLRKIIQKGETSSSFVARLGRIEEKAVELGAAAENVVTRFSTMFQGNTNIAQLLDIIGLQTPVKSARRFLHRLEKEVQRLGKISQTRKTKFKKDYERVLEVVQKASKAVSKANHARLMNENTGVGKKDSISEAVFGSFVIFEKAANKILDDFTLKDSEKKQQQLQIVLNRALDLLEISRRPSFRLYGYDASQDTGINIEERKRQIQEKIALVKRIGAMLKSVGGGGGGAKKKSKSAPPPPPTVTILKPRKKKQQPKKIAPPLLSPEERKNTFPDPVVSTQVRSPVLSICDIMPTLANTVIPMARYETVRIQVRRRGAAHAGVTDRTRKDLLFSTTDSLRKKYAETTGKAWPVSGLVLSKLDAEIYRRVYARQLSTSQFLGDNFTTNLLLAEDKTKAFKKLFESAADPAAMQASMGTDIFTGNSTTALRIFETMIEGKWLEDVVMGYILRVYLGVGKYDRSVVIEPLVWHETALEVSKAMTEGLPDRPAKWWLAAEIFQYKIPAEALPLGTDASDKILLNQCGISLVLFILNQENHHWTLLAYPVRRRPNQRRLYHYDSQKLSDLEHVQKLTEEPHVRLVEGGLFDKHIFDKDDESGEYKYFTTPSWKPEDLGCLQPHGWECGYMTVGLIDVLCRKTEVNPDSMNNPVSNDDKHMNPLQLGDIPSSLATYMNDLLEKARNWTDDIAGNTVWRIQEPDASYGDKRGAPDLLKTIRPRMKRQDEALALKYLKRKWVGEEKAKELTESNGACGLSRGETQKRYNTWGSWDLGNENYLHCVFGVVGKLGPDESPATVAAQAFPEILRNIFRTQPRQTTATDDDEEKKGFVTSVQASIAALDLQMFDSFKEIKGVDRTKHLWYENGLVCVCVLVSHAWIHLFNVGTAGGLVMTRATQRGEDPVIEERTRNTQLMLGNFKERLAVAGGDPMRYPNLALDLPREVLHTSRREKKNGGSTILLATPELLFKLGFPDQIWESLVEETRLGVTQKSCELYMHELETITFMIIDATAPKDSIGGSSVFPVLIPDGASLGANSKTKQVRTVSYLTASEQQFW